MRCREVKLRVAAQCDGDPLLPESDSSKLQEHLKQCPICRAYEQRQQRLNTLLLPATPRSYPSISTERIMLAVQRQKRITQQLENIRTQQQLRLAHMRRIVIPLAAITFFTVGSIPLLSLALTIVQPDLFGNILSVLSDVVDVLVVLIGYVQTILTLLTRDNRLLSGVALVLVVMMGMWLRLMRYPQEA